MKPISKPYGAIWLVSIIFKISVETGVECRLKNEQASCEPCWAFAFFIITTISTDSAHSSKEFLSPHLVWFSEFIRYSGGHGKSHLYCCVPQLQRFSHCNCSSHCYIRLPIKIGVASRNEDNRFDFPILNASHAERLPFSLSQQLAGYMEWSLFLPKSLPDR